MTCPEWLDPVTERCRYCGNRGRFADGMPCICPTGCALAGDPEPDEGGES